MMSSRPAKVATVVGEGTAALLCGLPDEIVVWEILVRLPPKALLRCRAVNHSGHRAASTRDLLLAHHCRQPSLPLFSVYKHGRTWNDIRAFDHRPAADAQFQLLARLDGSTIHVLASCDGLLLLWVSTHRSPPTSRHLICNPLTRQIARLPHTQLHGFDVEGLYPHGNAGEYRLLLRWGMRSCVASLGGDLPHPRRIGCTPDRASFFSTPVLVRGNLHWTWRPLQHQIQSGDKAITVFSTTAESFHLLQAPPIADTSSAYLFEMDGTLGMYGCNDSVVDIWAMQDYEVWLHKYRVELPLAEIRGKFPAGCDWSSVMVGCVDGRVVVLIHSDGHIMLQVDVEGKLLASSRYDGHSLFPSRYCLKQSLLLHNVFSKLQGSAWPFK